MILLTMDITAQRGIHRMIKCSNCGEINESESVYCKVCGANLSPEASKNIGPNSDYQEVKKTK